MPRFMIGSVTLAIILGALFGEISWAMYPLKEIGKIFISLLKMVVVPIAFVSITGAIIKLGSGKKIRGITAKAMLWMVVLSIAGVTLGGAVMTVLGVPSFDIGDAAFKEAKSPTFLEFILGAIPSNPVESFAKGNMLQIITCAFFTGSAVLCLEEREQISKVFNTFQKICFKITSFVLKVAPIGVFALLYPVAAKSFTHILTGYLLMIAALVIGSLIYMVICAGLLPKPLDFWKVVLPGDIIGAISGGATNYLAPRIETLKTKTTISHDLIDYLIPLLSVLMRSGSCICVGIYTIFAARVYGVELTLESTLAVILISVIALMAAPGIIGGTLMDCAIIWAAVGIPLEAVAVFAGIDYVMDVLRTVLNIQGGEIVTARVDAEKGDEKEW